MAERRHLLQDAALRWKLKQTDRSRCRICGGACHKSHSYCLRHYRCIVGHVELMTALAAGERLEEIDALITLKSRYNVSLQANGHLHLGSNRYVRRVETDAGTEWLIYYLDAAGLPKTLARVRNVEGIHRWLHEQRSKFSLHNRYAVKKQVT